MADWRSTVGCGGRPGSLVEFQPARQCCKREGGRRERGMVAGREGEGKITGGNEGGW